MTDELLDGLRRLTGNPASEFRAGQREAIEALVGAQARVLLVQRTGWGKSAIYFLATSHLRAKGFGPTLLVSPLLALIRNQVEAAERLGLRVLTVNSSTNTTIRDLTSALERDELDLLLISPERLANPEFADKVMPLVGSRPGLIVIDEVHCISDWGHDFRPDYRRLAQVINGLGDGIPVLGCTATANDRVVADVASQLGAELNVIRGGLRRDGLALHVVDLPSAAQRLAWLDQALGTLPGSGVIYALTVRDAIRVAEWLHLRGHAVLAYSGESDGDDRLRAEDALKHNEIKALVATSALGMGYDKPDLGFVIHYQAPGSPVAYYQQVGRAGRALDASAGVLLCGTEDRDIQDWFITTAFPDSEDVDAVLASFDAARGPLTLGRIEETVNMKRGELELVLKQLTVEGVVKRLSGQTYERTLKSWTYPTERVESVTAARRAEQQQMADYAVTPDCRMVFLTQLLDDDDAAPCGVCDRCTGTSMDVELDPALVAEAQRFLRSGYVLIDPRKKLPDTSLPVDRRVNEGRALCMLGDDGWGRLVVAGRKTGELDDRLIRSVVEMVADWSPDPAPQWVTFVPSLRRPLVVAALADRIGAALGVPVLPLVEKVEERPPQRHMQNGSFQYSNIAGAYAVRGEVPSTPCFLVDDIIDSRWTVTEVGRLLRLAGSGEVFPLALARRQGGDSSA